LARLASLRAPQPALFPSVAYGGRLPSGVIPEYAAKSILAEVGVPMPRSELVTGLSDAQRTAACIGYPVVLKAQSPALAHKSDNGGVALDIADDASLIEAWWTLSANIARAQPGLQLDGVLVEAMVRPGIELIVGVRNDLDWGPVLVVGLGGVLAEALRDVRVLPANLEPDAIIRELRRLKGAPLLTGFRGAPALDLGAVAKIASQLGQFAGAHPEITEIDINPLVVYPEQEGAIAVDALIVAC
jgi:succinyl-CoA synthetase beta subunit